VDGRRSDLLVLVRCTVERFLHVLFEVVGYLGEKAVEVDEFLLLHGQLGLTNPGLYYYLESR
jgi:hypothetical protein